MLTSLGLVDAAGGGDSRIGARRRVTLVGALLLHGTLAAGLVVVPLLREQDMPEPAGVRAFLATLPDLAPPPPPPPAPASRALAPAPKPAARAPEFVAPITVPDRVATEAADVAGLDAGVPGGVEGGVEGGVVGGVVGGLGEAPAPAPRVVRVGGVIHEPRLLHEVAPEYPQVAIAARIAGLVILELHVGADGVVREVNVLRADPLFADAAIEAARQRRYQPLLLDGVPSDFLVTVTMRFNLKSARA